MVGHKLPMYAFMVWTGTAVHLPLQRKARTTMNASVTFTSQLLKCENTLFIIYQLFSRKI